MIHIEPIQLEDERWKTWCEAAKKAGDKLEAADDVNNDLYKECRDLILERFHGKCAYCESRLDADQQFGDVEHFRPKGGVTDVHNKPVYLDADHTHPGYYWLAYDWENLFPACISCNRPGMHPDGTKAGKWNRFPVEGTRAWKRGDPLDTESPLLIDPYKENPSDHLKFDSNGVVGPRTERGRVTIEILGLMREGLLTMRKIIAKAATDDYIAYVNALMTGNETAKAERKAELEKYETGAAPYSAAAREAIAQLKALVKSSAGGP